MLFKTGYVFERDGNRCIVEWFKETETTMIRAVLAFHAVKPASMTFEGIQAEGWKYLGRANEIPELPKPSA